MWLAWRTLLSAMLLTYPVFFSMESVAEARIKAPQIEELVDSADLVVIGRVESVQATPPELRRQFGSIVLIAVAVSVAGFLLWRKRWSNAAIVVVACLLGITFIDVPYGENRKVAYLSVSSTIKGQAPPHELPIYYENAFVCDVTHLAAGKEYLLFLKELPSGYAPSWYDWSVWTIEDGTVQTERRTWSKATPLLLTEFVAKIRAPRGKPNQE